MKIFAGLMALVFGIASGFGVVNTYVLREAVAARDAAVADRDEWAFVAATLSQENSNLSERTYALITLTNPTSMSPFATKFAISVCSQDFEGILASHGPELAKSAADTAAAYSTEENPLTALDIVKNFWALPDDVRCTNAAYMGGFINSDNQYNAIYVMTYTDGKSTWSQVYIVSVTELGVDGWE